MGSINAIGNWLKMLKKEGRTVSNSLSSRIEFRCSNCWVIRWSPAVCFLVGLLWRENVFEWMSSRECLWVNVFETVFEDSLVEFPGKYTVWKSLWKFFPNFVGTGSGTEHRVSKSVRSLLEACSNFLEHRTCLQSAANRKCLRII